MAGNDEVTCEVRGGVGLISLTRPKALNALTLGMIRVIDPALRAWAADPAVKAVVIRGEGERAFCAGGDVRAIYDDGLAHRRGESDGGVTRQFFYEEYLLNRRIKLFAKPYVALIDGITMGGGVGLSVHGTRRVATERTMVAMPETGIGLFPDVGGTWFLPRCPGQLGTYMALAGTRLGAGDLLALGFATHMVPSDRLGALLDDLVATDWARGDALSLVDAVLAAHAGEAPAATLPMHREEIDRTFAHDRVEDILAALDREGTDWAAGVARTLAGMSPTSLKITLSQMRQGASLAFDDCMKLEYRMTQACMAGHDFYEGIRAQLVDKDRSPKWQPPTLDAVSDADVARHFADLGDRELVFAD